MSKATYIGRWILMLILLYWVWTGSRVALILDLFLIGVGLETTQKLLLRQALALDRLAALPRNNGSKPQEKHDPL